MLKAPVVFLDIDSYRKSCGKIFYKNAAFISHQLNAQIPNENSENWYSNQAT